MRNRTRLTRISHKSESGGQVGVAGAVFWTTGGPGKQGAVGKQGFFLERTANVCGCGQLRRRGAPEHTCPVAGVPAKGLSRPRAASGWGRRRPQVRQDPGERILPGPDRRKRERNPPNRNADGDLEKFRPNRPAPCPPRCRPGQPSPPWLANVAKSRRNWFARMVAVRSANRLPLRGSPRARSTVSCRGSAPPPACSPGKSRRSGRREDPAAIPPSPLPAASGSTTLGSGNGSRRTAPRRSRRSGGATCAIACAPSGGRCGTGRTGSRLRCLRATSRRGPPSPRTTVSGQRSRAISSVAPAAGVRRPQPRTQNQVIPVERKVGARVAVTSLLVAVHRVVGGVDVRKDLAAADKRRGTGLRSSPAATFLYRCVSASPGTPGPVHGARPAECRGPAPPRSGRPTVSASALSARSWSLTSS